MNKLVKYLMIFLLLIMCTTFLAVHSISSNKLRIVACDVGQGDAFLITYKSSQILIDGGPNKKVVNCVSDNIPFWDREIELVVLTHPQLDHYLGLIEVFKLYKVDNFLANNLDASTPEYRLLEEQVQSSTTRVILPQDTSTIKIGLIQLDILTPSSEFINTYSESKVNDLALKINKNNILGTRTTNLDPNEFSISTLVLFGNYKALFTGDLSPKISDEVAQILQKKRIGNINYIKVPHHGSKNGLTENLIEISRPEIAVISAGKNNSYGHPHKEILDMLEKHNVLVRRTDLEGNVVFKF